MNESDQFNPRDAGHESSAISMRAVGWSGIGLVVLIGVSLVLMWQLLGLLTGERAATASGDIEAAARASQPARLPDSPELDADQSVALRELRERELAVLNEYKWLDRQAGIARIPIDRAMEIVAERGLPEASGSAAPRGGETP